jgi:hypothetical protein
MARVSVKLEGGTQAREKKQLHTAVPRKDTEPASEARVVSISVKI